MSSSIILAEVTETVLHAAPFSVADTVSQKRERATTATNSVLIA
jgi:hypothetical protein